MHGFSADFKFTKNSTPQKSDAHAELDSHITSSTIEVTGGSAGGSTFAEQGYVILGLTNEQHYQLIHLLRQSNLDNPAPSSNCVGFANFIGKGVSDIVSPNTCFLSQVDNLVWILNSGATNLMTSNKSLFFNIQPMPIPYLVSLPNGSKVKVTNTVSLTLLPGLTLHHVLYIPFFY